MIIVTGATGLLGRILTKKLSINNEDYIGISRKSCNLSEVSLYDYVKSLTSSTPTTIIHLAANLPFGQKPIERLKGHEETKNIDINVYNASEEWGAKVIYASTLSLYKKVNPAPYLESSEVGVLNDDPYLSAKLIGENLFLQSKNNIILRLPAPIGQGLPRETVAGLFLEKAARDEVIEIWGSGLREQNYVDVEDIASAFMKASNAPTNGIFNIASPRPTTMKELAFLIVAIFQRGKIVFSEIVDNLEHQKALYACEKAKDHFGWAHSISLENSLRSIISSYDYN